MGNRAKRKRGREVRKLETFSRAFNFRRLSRRCARDPHQKFFSANEAIRRVPHRLTEERSNSKALNRLFSLTSEVMDSGSRLSDTAGAAMTSGRQHVEEEYFQLVVRSVVVLSLGIVGER
jgi:hypothetical protein